MRGGIASNNSFTFYLKNPTSQKQNLNLFKLGSKDNPTIKKDAFFQDGSSGGVLDLDKIVTKVLLDDDGNYTFVLEEGSQISIELYDLNTATHSVYTYNVVGTNTTWLDVLNNLNLQTGVFTTFGIISVSGSERGKYIIPTNGYWATNSANQFVNWFKVGFGIGGGTSSIGSVLATTPIGVAPVSLPNLSSSMVQINGNDYEEQNRGQVGSPIGADPFEPLRRGGGGGSQPRQGGGDGGDGGDGGGSQPRQGGGDGGDGGDGGGSQPKQGGGDDDPTTNLEINTISSNPLQLAECIVFTRKDTNGNLIGTAECPTIDPYQKQNINGIDTSDVIFDGNTKMSYGILGHTTAIQTYNYSQSAKSMTDSKNALNFEIGRELVDAIMVKEEEEEKVNFSGGKSGKGFLAVAVVLIIGFLILSNKK